MGAPQASQISLVKAFEASSRAAAAEGPKVRRPAARVASATPAASGASGPIDHEIDGVFLAEGHDRGAVQNVDIGAFGQLRDPRIARRHDQPVAFGVLLDRPGQRMFAPAAAQDEDIHARAPAWPLAAWAF